MCWGGREGYPLSVGDVSAWVGLDDVLVQELEDTEERGNCEKSVTKLVLKGGSVSSEKRDSFFKEKGLEAETTLDLARHDEDPFARAQEMVKHKIENTGLVPESP
jgi:hypothetical protein